MDTPLYIYTGFIGQWHKWHQIKTPAGIIPMKTGPKGITIDYNCRQITVHRKTSLNDALAMTVSKHKK